MQRRSVVLLALLSAVALAFSSTAMAAAAKTTKGTLVSYKSGALTVKVAKAKDTFVVAKSTKCTESGKTIKCAALDGKALVGKAVKVTWTKRGTKDDASAVAVTK